MSSMTFLSFRNWLIFSRNWLLFATISFNFWFAFSNLFSWTLIYYFSRKKSFILLFKRRKKSFENYTSLNKASHDSFSLPVFVLPYFSSVYFCNFLSFSSLIRFWALMISLSNLSYFTKHSFNKL